MYIIVYIYTSSRPKTWYTQVQKLKSLFTVSASDVRGFTKAIELSGGEPVAVLHHNKVQGYIVPAEAVSPIEYASQTDVDLAVNEIFEQDKAILEQLKDR